MEDDSMETINTFKQKSKEEFKKRFTEYGHGYYLNRNIPVEDVYRFITEVIEEASDIGVETGCNMTD